MSTAREPGTAGYARAIERRWSELLERAVVLSPREWALIGQWYERGIPFELVRECMEEALERPRARQGSGPRSLAAIAPALDEAWAVVLAGRLASSLAERVAPDDLAALAREAWQRRLEGEPRSSSLRRLLLALLERLDQGEAPERIDDELDGALAGAVAAEQVERARREVAREMAPVRQRMPAERFDATLRRATVERLRRQLEIPRLTSGGAC